MKKKKIDKLCGRCNQELIKRGFGEVGSLVGNARYECKNKECESNGK